MRSVVEWLCHMEDLMKVHDHDHDNDNDIRGMMIHIKDTWDALYILKAFNSLCHKVCTEIYH